MHGFQMLVSLRFDSIAPNWRKSTGDVAGLETGRLYETLKRMYEDCNPVCQSCKKSN